MGIFGRKKDEKKEMDERHPKIPTAEELRKMHKVVERPPQQREPEEPIPVAAEVDSRPVEKSFAPLFVKIDRYRSILTSIAELKTIMMMMKNTFSVLSELERIKSDSLKLIQNSLERIDKKLVALDSEFLRPSGFQEEFPQELHTTESLEATIDDLRSQVEQLRAEMKNIA